MPPCRACLQEDVILRSELEYLQSPAHVAKLITPWDALIKKGKVLEAVCADDWIRASLLGPADNLEPNQIPTWTQEPIRGLIFSSAGDRKEVLALSAPYDADSEDNRAALVSALRTRYTTPCLPGAQALQPAAFWDYAARFVLSLSAGNRTVSKTQEATRRTLRTRLTKGDFTLYHT